MENINNNQNVNVNEQEIAQVENNKKSVLKAAMSCFTNKYTLIVAVTAAVGAVGFYGWKAWKAKKAAAANTDADFEEVTDKKK